MTAPKRRWFAYSLRTLFVVITVLGCWLGYEWNWIRQRHEMLAKPEACIIEGSTISTSLAIMKAQWNAEGLEPASAPGLLWLFGEQGVTELRVFIRDVDDFQHCETCAVTMRASRLFPESRLSFAWGQVTDPKGNHPEP